MNTFKGISSTLLAVAFLVGCNHAQKQVKLVLTENDLPSVIYPAPEQTQELIQSSDAFARFAKPVRSDLLRLQSDPAIRSVRIRKRVLEVLTELDVLSGDFKDGLQNAIEYRHLQTKPGPRLTSLLVERAYMEAGMSVRDTKSPGFETSFQEHLQKIVHAMPYDVAWFELVGVRGGADSESENDIKEEAERDIEPTRRKANELSRQMAWQVVGSRCRYFLSRLRQRVFNTIRNEELSHGGEPKGIWPDREVSLNERAFLHPVIVGIWDTGVDSSIFGNHMWTNGKERQGKENHDGNGYPGDLHGISFGPHYERVAESTWPLSEQAQKRMGLLSALTKGSVDVFGDPGTPEAALYKKTMATITPADRRQLDHELQEVGFASHGTACADIAIAGNPAARIMNVRMSNYDDFTHIAPTRDSGKHEAEMFHEIMSYLKQHHARVVNMSWSATAEDYERGIEKYGNVKNPAERREIARTAFEDEKKGLIASLRSAPEILFVAAAGNDDEETNAGHRVPADLTAPNLITVGAVDPVGNPVDFSNYGPGVAVYASAFTRARMLGGTQRIFVGTSAAAPEAVNLAAKLLAINPDLAPPQVIDLMKKGATENANSHIPLLNPKNSVALLQKLLSRKAG